MSDLGTGAGEGAALATTALVGKSMRVGPSSPSEQSYAIHDSTGITVTTHIEELLPFCVHDPAWWWVKASNLGTPSGVVVRFNLAHVRVILCGSHSWMWVVSASLYHHIFV